MLLSIRVKKEPNSQSVLTVGRPDGTTTYSRIHNNFEIHDIAHYVVEEQLGFKNAFYGLLSQGYQIDEFQLPKEIRPIRLRPEHIPQEALVTEHLVNLLTIDFMQPESKMDIFQTFKTILIDKNLPFPKSLDNEKLASIQKGLSDLMYRWNELKNGQELTLELRL
ncbi:MAG: hypothetical protein ACR2MT_04750 [Aurantibacter sp.]